ncbi:hypothetical protein RB595_005818 [Gaeumannomyces hyphopodioides]
MATPQLDSGLLTEAISHIPACATPCAMRGIEASKCHSSNIICYCQDGFTEHVQNCVLKACKPRDQLALRDVLDTVCPRPRYSTNQKLYTDVIWAGLAVSTIFVFVRLWAKTCMSPSTSRCRSPRMGALWWDDLCIFLSLLALGVAAAVDVTAIAPLLGQDMWSLRENDLGSFFFWETLLLMPLYFLQATLIRASFIFFFMRVFETTTPDGGAFVGVTFRALLLGTHVTNTMAGIALAGVYLGQCQPVSYAWTKWEDDSPGTCALDPLTVFTITAAVSAVMDVWLIILPLSQLPRMQHSLGKKMGFAVMFCLGGTAALINLGRLVSLDGLGRGRAAKGLGAGYSYYSAAMWTELETVSGMVCACLPAARAFALWIWTRARGLALNVGESGSIAPYLPRSRGASGRHNPRAGSSPSASSRTDLVRSDHELSDISMAWLEDPIKREGNGGFDETQSAGSEGTTRFVVRKHADGKWRIAKDV